jgi:hypothetical protein
VAAAPATFGQAVAAVTMLEWLLVAVLSTLAGITALFIRISAAINDAPPDQAIRPIRNIWLLVGAQMCGSWLAGLCGFFVASQFGMAGLLVGFWVPMCAFGGAKLLELAYNKFIKSKFDAMP